MNIGGGTNADKWTMVDGAAGRWTDGQIRTHFITQSDRTFGRVKGRRRQRRQRNGSGSDHSHVPACGWMLFYFFIRTALDKDEKERKKETDLVRDICLRLIFHLKPTLYDDTVSLVEQALSIRCIF